MEPSYAVVAVKGVQILLGVVLKVRVGISLSRGTLMKASEKHPLWVSVSLTFTGRLDVNYQVRVRNNTS